MEEINKKYKFGAIHGILFDLGMSSWHLEKSGRGFSFQRNEPLDMRYKVKCQNCLTAEEIINKWPESEIEKILIEYGEEKFAKRIARKIIDERKIRQIKSTLQLVEIIKKAGPISYRIHPATKTFQALRIAVNNELDNLNKAIPQAIKILKPNGKLIIISLHSLEDRIVKNFFKENAQKSLIKILTKKPIQADNEEIKINPRSRSAKLRAAIKI